MNLRTVKDAVMTELPKGLDEVTVLADKQEAVNLYEEDERV